MAFSAFNSFQTFLMYVRARVSGSAPTFTYNFPALDPSLVLYYPLDSSANPSNGFQTANFASRLPVYDASMSGSAMISYALNNSVTSFGDLSLNNTMGSQLVANTINGNYVVSNTSFALNISGGFSVSLWFSCSGQLNKTGTLISLPLNKTSNGIQIDISGPNMIYTGWNKEESSLVLYWPFDTTLNETINNQAPTTVNGTPSIINSVVAVGTGSFNGAGGSKYTLYTNPNGILPISTGYTISIWLYPLGSARDGQVFTFADNSTTFSNQISSTYDTLYFYVGILNGGGSVFNSGGQLVCPKADFNTWSHIVISFPTGASGPGVFVNYWLNGIKATITDYIARPIPAIQRNSVYINGLNAGGTNYICDSYIDDVRVYNRQISSLEVQSLYNLRNS
jgi:hypothetical protein